MSSRLRRAGGLLFVLCCTVCAFAPAIPAAASLSHAPLLPHLKVMMIAYANTYTPEELAFMAAHYDARIGGGVGAGDAPSFTYTNYYCMYVGGEEYTDAQQWAEAHGVDFEAFFLHYAEPTTCHPYTGPSYALPTGSRVPTYDWYGTEGDLTKTGARVVMDPGNPDYRAWKLDYVARLMEARGGDGLYVDNTSFSFLPGAFTVVSGGAVAEYPDDFAAAYGDDLLKLFAEFHAAFGEAKVQVANMGVGDDPRVYPYLWGVFREGMDQPNGVPHFPTIDKVLSASRAAGVQNLIGSSWTDPRWDMAALAFFYLVQDDTCYFFPSLQYVSAGWAGDPRQNQWYEAVAYDVGAPRAARWVVQSGIEPSASARDLLSATVTKSTPYVYRLTDPAKHWADQQWRNAQVVFPDGFTMAVYQSGANWIDLYSPKETPVDGLYQLGTATYSVLGRDYERALVLFRPKASAASDTGEASAVTVPLPVTADNTSGRYYLLTRDGTLDPTPRTSLSLRNSDGAVLVKESSARSLMVFTDVPAGFWAHDEIYAAAGAGIVQGFRDGSYRPKGQVTRDQMAVYLARALCHGDEHLPTGPAQATFADVAPGYWAYDHIEYALAHGVVTGFRDGTYRPTWTVNRGQMAAFLARALVGGDDYLPTGPAAATFADVPADFPFSRHVEYIYSQGITTGYADGTFHPEYACLRDQMAVFVSRAFRLLP